jgi:hypothetical protein
MARSPICDGRGKNLHHGTGRAPVLDAVVLIDGHVHLRDWQVPMFLPYGVIA